MATSSLNDAILHRNEPRPQLKAEKTTARVVDGAAVHLESTTYPNPGNRKGDRIFTPSSLIVVEAIKAAISLLRYCFTSARLNQGIECRPAVVVVRSRTPYWGFTGVIVPVHLRRGIGVIPSDDNCIEELKTGEDSRTDDGSSTENMKRRFRLLVLIFGSPMKKVSSLVSGCIPAKHLRPCS